MAVTKITYENKTAIQNDASVSRKNKVVDEDMNEIKQVVNNNADEVTTMQENIEDLQNGQGTASADITSLKNRVSTLETDNTQNKSDINTLKSDNQTNKSNISTMQEQISDIQQEQTQQNKDIENLQINDNKQDELISKLKSAALNAETEEAKSLHVTDANKFGQLEVFGNHEQETREGYNLLQNKLTDTTINGVTFTINEDKSVTVNGTATASIIANLITGEYNDNNATEPLIIPDNITNCRLSGCPSGGSSSTYKLDIYNQEYALLATDWGEGTNVTIDSQEDKKIARVRIIIYSGATVNNLTFKPMLVAGTEEREYEQYGASPSPEYPSKIVCLGSNKQLFDKSTAVEGLLQGDGTLSYSDNNYSTSDFIKVVPKKSYYKTITGSSRFKFFDEEKSPISSTYNDLIDPTKAQSFEIPENAHYMRFTFLKTYIDEIKIEEGTEATSYSPYEQGSTEIKMKNADETQEKSYTLPIQQEMLKGDYFVKEADGWKEVHIWNKYVFSGNESIAGAGVSNAYYMSSITDYLLSEENICISNYFKSINNVEGAGSLTDEDNVICFNNNHTNYRLYIKSSQYASSAELKESLQQKNTEGNPAYVTYKTTTPTKLPCTEEQSAVLEELSNMDLFEGVNNIITAEDIALLKLKYSLDVETYIDNKLNTINQQILEIVGGN